MVYVHAHFFAVLLYVIYKLAVSMLHNYKD